jgi:hypothetical protein
VVLLAGNWTLKPVMLSVNVVVAVPDHSPVAVTE